MIYKKNKFILQVLPIIYFITVIFYTDFNKIVVEAHAADYFNSKAEIETIVKKGQKGIDMNEKKYAKI